MNFFCRSSHIAALLVVIGEVAFSSASASTPLPNTPSDAISSSDGETVSEEKDRVEEIDGEDDRAEELIGNVVPSDIPSAPKEVIDEINKEIIETDAELILSEKSENKVAESPTIPFEINQNVRKWIHYFSKQDHERFQRFLDRGEAYKSLVKRLLRESGVPAELYYLAMIESGYVIQAKSHASAVGPWQFILGTGQRYGLLTARTIDERRDIIRATQSAARYLRGLHMVFQDWYLAMAAYNAGEGRIVGAILRGDTRNFWKLVELKALPAETQDYVPKFLAAAIIGRHPERYGFVRNEVELFPDVEAATLPGGVSLSRVSEKLGISPEKMQGLNPHLLRGVTPFGMKGYDVWVPVGTAEKVEAVAGSLEVIREFSTTKGSSKQVKRYHVIRSGESLAGIAKRYGLTQASLKKMNGLRSNRVVEGKRLVVVKSRTSVSMR